jgi:hypothetical protein
MDDLVIYTPETPLVKSDGSLMVSIEALRPGDVIMVRSYGYVGDGAPIGWYVGMVLWVGPPEPVIWGDIIDGERRICTYDLLLLLSGDRSYIDKRSVIEGTLYEFVC